MVRVSLSICALFGSLLLVALSVLPDERSGKSPRPIARSRDAAASRTQPELRAAANTQVRLVAASSPPAAGARETAENRAETTPDEHLAATAEQCPGVGNDQVEDAYVTPDDLQLWAKRPGDLPLPGPTLDGPIFAEPKSPVEDRPATREIAASEPRVAVVTVAARPQGIAAVDGKPEAKSEAKTEAASTAAERAWPLPGEPLTPELEDLRGRVRNVLDLYYERRLNADTRSTWAVMHSLIAYGVDTEIYTGARRVNAIGWICYNGRCNGDNLFYLSNGKLRAKTGPGLQGHEGQFLAMLAQSRVRTDFPMKVDGQDLTVADLIEYEKLSCRPRTELTFKLIALSHYLDSDATWKDDTGSEWDMQRLIKEELAQPINGAACGGTHRMTGFSYAIRNREKEGKPLVGQWARAKKFVDQYHDYTLRLQNPDGSFSTSWFASRGNISDNGRKVQTTGHMLEWLVYSLPEDRLFDPQVVKAVDFLTKTLDDYCDTRWEIGPQGHALHALVIYNERAFGAKPGQRLVQVAKKAEEKEEK